MGPQDQLGHQELQAHKVILVLSDRQGQVVPLEAQGLLDHLEHLGPKDLVVFPEHLGHQEP